MADQDPLTTSLNTVWQAQDSAWHTLTGVPLPPSGIDHYSADVGYYDALVSGSSPSGATSVSWFSLFRSYNYLLGLGSMIFNILALRFKGWIKKDPLQAFASIASAASVFFSLPNLVKGKKQIAISLALTIAVTITAVLLYEKWWKPNNPPKVSAAGLSPKEAAKAQDALANTVHGTVSDLSHLGMASPDLLQTETQYHFIEGTAIAAQARAYQGPEPLPVVAPSGNLKVVGHEPTVYASLAQLPTKIYFTSLSSPRTSTTDILENSAAAHAVSIVSGDRP